MFGQTENILLLGSHIRIENRILILDAWGPMLPLCQAREKLGWGIAHCEIGESDIWSKPSRFVRLSSYAGLDPLLTQTIFNCGAQDRHRAPLDDIPTTVHGPSWKLSQVFTGAWLHQNLIQ